ncbi:MAG TPA: iron-sulfur cluster assembly protein, partial [Mycobacteriales bacterium]
MSTAPTETAVRGALDSVKDPEIGRPVTELDMVESIEVDGSTVTVTILLTVSGCPMRDEITTRVENAVGVLDGVQSVVVRLGVMTDEQRKALTVKVRGEKAAEREIPFA